MRSSRVFFLAVFFLACGLALSSSAVALDTRVSATATEKAQETVAAMHTAGAEATADAFRSKVSKAYMNCLFDADDTAEGLANNPQARDAESRAHRTFCLTRKESCLRLGEDDDCRVFIEEFTE
jgi:hypothetical protein